MTLSDACRPAASCSCAAPTAPCARSVAVPARPSRAGPGIAGSPLQQDHHSEGSDEDRERTDEDVVDGPEPDGQASSSPDDEDRGSEPCLSPASGTPWTAPGRLALLARPRGAP